MVRLLTPVLLLATHGTFVTCCIIFQSLTQERRPTISLTFLGPSWSDVIHTPLARCGTGEVVGRSHLVYRAVSWQENHLSRPATWVSFRPTFANCGRGRWPKQWWVIKWGRLHPDCLFPDLKVSRLLPQPSRLKKQRWELSRDLQNASLWFAFCEGHTNCWISS